MIIMESPHVRKEQQKFRPKEAYWQHASIQVNIVTFHFFNCNKPLRIVGIVRRRLTVQPRQDVQGLRILCSSTLLNYWNSSSWAWRFFLARFSHILRSSSQALPAQRCKDWQIHLNIAVAGNSIRNLLATELFTPTIVLHPSDANPIKFLWGISFPERIL